MAKMDVTQLEVMSAVQERWDREHDAQLMLTIGAVMLAIYRTTGEEVKMPMEARVSVDMVAAMTRTHTIVRDFDPSTKEWIYTLQYQKK